MAYPSEYNSYPCPSCEADVSVALPLAKYATCDECKAKLEIHVDAEFDEDGWHDLTTLSVVDEQREHMKKMLKHLTQDEHKA